MRYVFLLLTALCVTAFLAASPARGQGANPFLDRAEATPAAADSMIFWDSSANGVRRASLDAIKTYVTSSLGLSAYATNAALTDSLDARLATAQPLDPDLTSIAALSTTTFGRAILAEASASSLRSTLGLVIGSNVQAFDADLTTYAGITPSANVQSLLGAASYAAVLSQLGLTNAYVYDGFRSVTTDYAFQSGDESRTVVVSGSSDVEITLPATAGVFSTGDVLQVVTAADYTGTLTFAPASGVTEDGTFTVTEARRAVVLRRRGRGRVPRHRDERGVGRHESAPRRRAYGQDRIVLRLSPPTSGRS